MTPRRSFVIDLTYIIFDNDPMPLGCTMFADFIMSASMAMTVKPQWSDCKFDNPDNVQANSSRCSCVKIK